MFFERPQTGDRAILVQCIQSPLNSDTVALKAELKEFERLSISAGAIPLSLLTCSGNRIAPQTFIGSGKLEELRHLVQAEAAQLVIFNQDLAPTQERNLESELKCRVLGRTGLILDIFAQRASTHEGKLQVELAQLQHISTRLIRGWTHLERQQGGIGLRGPGESQLETDRRLLQVRIKSIHKRLQKVRNQGHQNRQARARSKTPVIALVGYTNAGKSTLFNCLTDADVYSQDQLFATLDPTIRQWVIPFIGATLVTDTVGFISRLPHQLIKAFQSTLEEVSQASLLLHVIDANDPVRKQHIEQVNQVLEEINASKIPQLRLYNKIDTTEDAVPKINYDSEGKPQSIWLSAAKGVGIDLLRQAVSELLAADSVSGYFQLAPHLGALRADLHKMKTIESEKFNEDGSISVKLHLLRSDWQRLLRQYQATEYHYYVS